jgi:hypothetical protein
MRLRSEGAVHHLRGPSHMKKLVHHVVLGTFGLLSLACGASPDAVCDHTLELMKKELGEEAVKAFPRDECIKQIEREKEMQGIMKYRTEANCIMDAKTLADMEKCESK